MEGERGKSVTAITAIAGVGASGAVAVAIVVTSCGAGLGSGRLKVWRCSSSRSFACRAVLAGPGCRQRDLVALGSAEGW